MAEMLIYWDEIEDGAFPDCCMACGAEDTSLVQRKLMTYHFGYRRYMYAELPFCRAHASRPWVYWGRTDAKAFTDDGVWMRNLAPIFVEEMEAFREEEEEYEERGRRKKHGKRRRRSSDDRDDEEREPFSDPPRRTPQPSGGGIPVVLTVIFALLMIPALLGGACCVGNLFMGGPRVNVNQGPPMGPVPMFKNRP